MAHLITGYAGTEHIQSKDQGSFNAAFFGDGQFVMEAGSEFEASIIDNNTVRILDGDLLMYGRHVRIEPNTYEDMTIQTGTAGKNRIDLICMQYEKDSNDGTESASLVVIRGTESEGTPIAPNYTNGNILEGAVLNQMPLYKVLIEGVVLSDVVQLFRTQPTYAELAAQYEQEFQTACQTYLNSLNILDTMEEIEANTQANQLTGALATKALSGRLHGYSFYRIGDVNLVGYVADDSFYKDANGDYILANSTTGQALLQDTTTYKTIANAERVYSWGADSCSPFSSNADLLWTNPSPTSNFSAQTVSLDLTNYVGVIIITEFSTLYDGSPRTAIMLTKFDGSEMRSTLGITVRKDLSGSENRNTRVVTAITDTGVTFGGGIHYDGSASNSHAIPLYIFGIKSLFGLDDYINGTE